MPPYKAWTITPRALYGDYKPEEYQAEISAGRAQVDRMRAEAEAERLAAAQRLSEQKHALIEEDARRQWAREIPIELLNRQREHEIKAQEQALLEHMMDKKYRDRRQELEIERFRAGRDDKVQEAAARLEKEDEKRRGWRPWLLDADAMKDYLNKEGALPDFAQGAALGALGKKDAARRAVDPPGMPKVREYSVGKREYEDRQRIEDAKYDHAIRVPVEDVIKMRDMNSEFLRRKLEQQRADEDNVKKRGVVEGIRLDKALRGPTPEETMAKIAKASTLFDPLVVTSAASIGLNLNRSLRDWNKDVTPVISAAIERTVADLRRRVEGQIGRLSNEMESALRMSFSAFLSDSNVMENIFQYVDAGRHGSREIRTQRSKQFQLAYAVAVNKFSSK